MSFGMFLEKNIAFILFQFSLCVILFFIFFLLEISLIFAIFLIFVILLFTFLYLYCIYFMKKKRALQIIHSCNELEEKYYISEMIRKDNSIEGYPYYYALKEASKAMNDKISEIEKNERDYQEYIESFAHEIKTPIAALSLYADNQKDESLKYEIRKIEEYVEQVLYYARSDAAEKDYFVKKIKLNELIHPLVLKNKDILLHKHIMMNVHDLNVLVYTDEKWVSFMISQVFDNAIKYLDKVEKTIEIYSEIKDNQVVLVILDNGCGIRASDMPRIFDKGFTGSDRKKEYATGIGLYLVRKLSEKLDIKVFINSKYQEYTKVSFVFPKSKIYEEIQKS